MTNAPNFPSIPMWVRALVAGEDIKAASHDGFTIRARHHVMAVYPDPAAAGKVADSKAMVAYMNVAQSYNGVWHPIPRMALVGFLHTLADQAAVWREWDDDINSFDDDDAAPPPPPHPTICRFLDTSFVPANLLRFCASLPAEDVEWAVALTPQLARGRDQEALLLARWGKDGAFAGIMAAKPSGSYMYQPVFEESGWQP